jgi:hypothetical protein
LFRLATGTYRFDRAAVGGIFSMEDGLHFRVFRRVIDRKAALRPAGAAFRVRFKPIGMGIEQNIRFSRFPMILMLGFPGFRAKFWTVEDATGLCMGIYEWATVADARRYATSIAMRFMAGRSQPGSVSYEVIDQSAGRYWACEGPRGKSQAR